MNDSLAQPENPAHTPPAMIPVIGLGVGQVICYGTLYYAYTVTAPKIAAEFGWDISTALAAFSLALLVGGLVGPLAGRYIDHKGGRRAMVWGSVLSAVSLALLSQAQGLISLTLALTIIELVSTLTLYDAAFAAIAQLRKGMATRRAITQITLFGGIASTIFWPLTDYLLSYMDWRTVYLVYAGLQIVVCLPLHFLVLRDRYRNDGELPALARAKATAAEDLRLPTELHLRAMNWLVTSFCLSGFIFSALNVHWVGTFGQLGISSTTALAAGALMGPAQIGIRFVDMIFGTLLNPLKLAAIASAVLIVAAISVVAMPSGFWGAALFAVFFGFGQGLTSIVRGTAPLTLFGPSGYATRLGTISAIRVVVTSVAPFVFSILVEKCGGSIVMLLVAVVSFLSILCIFLIPKSNGSVNQKEATT
jgi:MFS family permease